MERGALQVAASMSDLLRILPSPAAHDSVEGQARRHARALVALDRRRFTPASFPVVVRAQQSSPC